jgi:hypothetical protein
MIRKGLAPVIVGAACGLTIAFASTGVLRAFLFGIGPSDPVTLIAVVFVLLAASLAAVVGPARRAANVDPLVALRRNNEGQRAHTVTTLFASLARSSPSEIGTATLSISVKIRNPSANTPAETRTSVIDG